MGVTEGVPTHTSAEAEQTTGNTPEVRCGVWSGWREISVTYPRTHQHIYTYTHMKTNIPRMGVTEIYKPTL